MQRRTVSERPLLVEVFAARLAEARRMRGLSQRRLGEAVGLTKKAGSTRISRYEQGGSFVTVPTLEALAAALDIPAAALLADTADLAEGILLLGSHVDTARLVRALQLLATDSALLDSVLDHSGER